MPSYNAPDLSSPNGDQPHPWAEPIDELRREVEDLVARMAVEVRTRRLVIAGEDGTDRIVARVTGDAANLSVLCETGLGSADLTGIELVVDGERGDRHAGVHLIGNGQSFGGLLLTESDGEFELHRSFDD